MTEVRAVGGPRSDEPSGSWILGVCARAIMWAPAVVFLAMILADLVCYSASRAAMSALSRDIAVRVATNRLPADLVPPTAWAELPFGDRAVRIVTVEGRDVVMDFTLDTGDATLFGLVDLVAGATTTVRSTVRRDWSVTAAHR